LDYIIGMKEKEEIEDDLISRKEALQVVNDIIDQTATRSRDMGRLNLVKLGLGRLDGKSKRDL
jgi:hypothetical protein